MGCMICHQEHSALETCGQCEFDAFVRNHFFTGKMMGAAEFATETLYHSEKMRHHNARLHGSGAVCGLKVHAHPSAECRKRYVVVTPGSALDCCGREILVAQEEIVDVARHPALVKALDADRARGVAPLHTLQLCVAHRECPTEDVPVLYDECGCDDTKCAPNRILESFRFDVLVDPPLPGADLIGRAPLGAFVASDAHGLTGFRLASGAGKVLAADPGDASRLFVIDARFRSMQTIALGAPARAATLSADGNFVFAVVASQARIFKVEDASEIVPADATKLQLPAAATGALAGAGGSGDNGFVVYSADSGKAYRWKADATKGLVEASPGEVALDTGLSGVTASADAAVLYGITSAGKVKQYVLAGGTKEFTTPTQPGALAAFALGSTPKPLLAVASKTDKKIYLVDLGAAPTVLAATIDVDRPPLYLGAAVDPAGSGDDVWLQVLEEESAHLYTQAISLKPLTANPAGDALLAAPRLAADGVRAIVLLFADGQAGVINPAALADSDCADHLWKQLEGCPGCELPDCVVLATIANYQADNALLDKAPNPLVPYSLIDNHLGRRIVASTATLQAWLQCLQLKGGIPGPKGDPGIPGNDGKDGQDGKDGKDGKDGNDGADGKNGTDGKDGKDGVGLETGLTRIVATSWTHAKPYYGNDSPLAPITVKISLATGTIEEKFGNALVIGFSAKVNGPDPAKVPWPYPVVMEVMIREPGPSGTVLWYNLVGLLLPVTSFTDNGAGLITAATIQFNGNTPPTQGMGYAFIIGKTQLDLMRTTDLVLVKLRGDFVVDIPGKALDAEFARAQFPTGDGPQGTPYGLQGGLFESWFGLRRGDAPPAGATGTPTPSLNHASAFELALVPGMGMERAEAIVAAREARADNRFAKFDDLRGVAGIDTARLNLIKAHSKLG